MRTGDTVSHHTWVVPLVALALAQLADRRRGPSGLASDELRRLSALPRPGRRGRRLLAGLVADWFGFAAAIHAVAVLTLLSGMVVMVRMRETVVSNS